MTAMLLQTKLPAWQGQLLQPLTDKGSPAGLGHFVAQSGAELTRLQQVIWQMCLAEVVAALHESQLTEAMVLDDGEMKLSQGCCIQLL